MYRTLCCRLKYLTFKTRFVQKFLMVILNDEIRWTKGQVLMTIEKESIN